jgi:hypothetical protein
MHGLLLRADLGAPPSHMLHGSAALARLRHPMHIMLDLRLIIIT